MATTNEQLETSEFAGTDIDSSIPFRLIRIVNLMARSFPSDHTTKHNVTLIEWRIMAVIGSHPSTTMTEIAHYTGYGQMHVSRSVKQLLAHGFVVRAKDRFDRRKNIIELTELGRSVNKKLSAGAKAMEKELLSQIPDQDLKKLNHILNTMLDYLYSNLE